MTEFVPRCGYKQCNYVKIFAVINTIYAIVKEKSEKNSDFNGIRTRDLCDTGAVLYQLSYEATTVGSGSVLLGPSVPS